MMKAKYNVFFAWCLMLASGLWTACSDDAQSLLPTDLPEEEEQPLLGEGQFIVRYGTSDASSARALSEKPLPANQRISSLHYFVYEKKTGELIKQRQIRGIGPNTTWPIGDRKGMPWELRQDLQDTLVSGYTYRILFIANADSTLFKKTDGTVHPAVLRDVEKYGSAKLLLPEVPFSDNNMYYLWEDSLKAKAGTTVKRNDVMLRRLVTRTDVSRMEIADMDNHLYKVMEEKFDSLYNIRPLMETHINGFRTRLIQEITKKYKPYAERLDSLLEQKEIQETLYVALKKQIINGYVQAVNDEGNIIHQQLKAWPKSGFVNLTYTNRSRVNALSFKERNPQKFDSLPQKEKLEVKEGLFQIVGFLGGEGLNGISQFAFEEAPSTNFVVKGSTLWLGKEMNRRYEAVCNPVKRVTIETTGTFKPTLNFDEVLKGNKEWDFLKTFTFGGNDNSFFDNVNKKVFTPDWAWQDKIYGDNFDGFLFNNIEVPLINKGNVDTAVKLYPSWKVTRVEY